MQTDPNPYQSPRDEDCRRPDPPVSFLAFHAIRWRLAPAILFGVLGAVGVAVGLLLLFMLGVTVARALSDPDLRSFLMRTPEFVLVPLAWTLLMTGWGLLWLVAARSFWYCRWKLAVVSLAIGLALFIIASNMPTP